MNMIIALFSALLLLIVTLGVPCTLDVGWIPNIVKEIYVYGKPTKPTENKRLIINRLVRYIQIPKRYKLQFKNMLKY